MHNINTNHFNTLYNPQTKLSSFIQSLLGFGCKHRDKMLVKYEIRHSTNPEHIGTEFEYYEVELFGEARYYKCLDCQRKLGYLFNMRHP